MTIKQYNSLKEDLSITQNLLKDWEYVSDIIYRYPAFQNLTLIEVRDWFSNKYIKHENAIREQLIDK